MAIVTLHLALSRSLTAPYTYIDEMGYLANARFLAGVQAPVLTELPFYHFGYSLLIAPLYALLEGPTDVYRATLALNAALAAATVLVLTAVARDVLRLRAAPAVAAAAVVAAYPAYLLLGNGAWSENALVPLAALHALLAFRLVRGGSWEAVLALAAATASTYAVHGRAIVVVAATAVLLLALAAARLLAPRLAAAGLATTALGVAAAFLVNRHLDGAIWLESAGPRVGDLVPTALDPGEWPAIAARVAGQVWYLTLGSAGLWLLGAALLTRVAWRGGGGGGREALARRVAAALVLAVSAGVILVTAVFFTSGFGEDGWTGEAAPRVDTYFYGRYTEGVAAVVLVAGVAWLLERRPTHRGAAAWAAVAATVVAGAGLMQAAVGRDLLAEGVHNPAGALAVTSLAGIGTDAFSGFPLWRTAGVGLAAAAVVALAWSARRALGVAAVGVIFVASGTVATERHWRPAADAADDLLSLHESVARIRDAGPIAFDLATPMLGAASGYQFWLHDRSFRMFDTAAGERPQEELIIAPPAWPGPVAGARVAAVENGPAALWVIPGTLQRRLAGEGRLFPGRPADPLPARARKAYIRPAADVPEPLRMRPGGSRSVPVLVTHRGEGSPWVQTTVGQDGGGMVVVQASWVSDASSRPVGAQVGALPRTVWTGETVEVDLRLRASDPRGRPLPVGAYTVIVAASQVGVGRLGGPRHGLLVVPVVVGG